MPNDDRIFLAHANEDKPRVKDLYHRLKADGFSPWLDSEDLIPGQNWRTEIPKAIKSAAIFLACLSSQSINKHGYVQQELRRALSAYGDRPPGKIYLIPARLDDCQIPELEFPELGLKLRDLHWVDLFEADGFQKLVKAVQFSLAQETTDDDEDTVPPDSEPEKVPFGFSARLDEVAREAVETYRDEIVQKLLDSPTALDALSGSDTKSGAEPKARAEALATQLLKMSVEEVQDFLYDAHQRLWRRQRQAASVCFDIARLILPAVYSPDVIAHARQQMKDQGVYVVHLDARLEMVADIIMAAATGRELRVKLPSEDGVFPDDAYLKLDLPPNTGRGGQSAYLAAWDDYLWSKFGKEFDEPDDRAQFVDEELAHRALKRRPPEIYYVVLPKDRDQRKALELAVKSLNEKYRHLMVVALAVDSSGLTSEAGRFRSFRDMAYQEGRKG